MTAVLEREDVLDLFDLNEAPPVGYGLEDDEIIIDCFAGGGGASLGIEWATGRSPDEAINHSETALAIHAANHPNTRHHHSDVWEVDPHDVARGRRVGILWLSPDCTHFSRAKGGKPRSSGRFAPKHGMNGTPEYRSWQSMKSRCLNPNFTGYPNYGGRGIQICDRWMSFANFFDDMGARPSLRYSLDRIDTDGHYEPANCRWATREQQNRNQRKTVITPELLTEIRQSPENSHRLAKRLGLTMSIVYRIRAGESWYAESGE